MNAKEKEQREVIQRLIAAAATGKLPWLHDMICAKGYRSPSTTMSTKDISELYGVSRQSVGLWRTKQGCPANDDGTYDLHGVIRWRELRIRDQVAGDQTDNLDRLRKAKAEREEIKLELERGELIPKADVERGLVQRVRILKSSLLHLPRRMAGLLQGQNARQIEAMLKEELIQLIKQYANQK